MTLMVLYGSSRRDGNSEALAERVVDGLAATRVHLSDWRIAPICDQRHEEGGFSPVDDDYDRLITQVMASDVLIFATPLYWYGMSGGMKDFVDRWSQSLRDRRYDFKGSMATKEAYVLITGGDYPRLKGLPLVQQFAHIFDYVGMRYGGYIIGEGNRPGEILVDQRALFEADWLNDRLRSHIALQ